MGCIGFNVLIAITPCEHLHWMQYNPIVAIKNAVAMVQCENPLNACRMRMFECWRFKPQFSLDNDSTHPCIFIESMYCNSSSSRNMIHMIQSLPIFLPLLHGFCLTTIRRGSTLRQTYHSYSYQFLLPSIILQSVNLPWIYVFTLGESNIVLAFFLFGLNTP